MRMTPVPALTTFAVLACTALLLWPADAKAYVDPGILGQLYQLWYVFVFGILSVIVTRPYRYLQALTGRLFGRSRREERHDEDETPPPSA
jgi:hypothetical protein